MKADQEFLASVNAICMRAAASARRAELLSQAEHDWHHMVREQLKCAAGLTHEVFPQLVNVDNLRRR